MARPFSMLAVCAGLFVAISGCKSHEVTLDALSSSSAVADGICTLKPLDHTRGTVFFDVPSNPFVSTDPQVIQFVSMWLLFPGRSAAGLKSYFEEGTFEREVELIEAVYVAMYESSPGGPETGVYGLQFRDAIPRKLREMSGAAFSRGEGVGLWS